METTISILALIVTLCGNLLAVSVAGFGVYRGAIADLTHEREERSRLQHLLDECQSERDTLRATRSSAINVSGGAVTIGGDAVGGDSTVGRDVQRNQL